MNNEFVSYEIALKLKQLGFDEPCFTYYYELTSNLRTHLGVDINNAWTYSGNKKLGFTLAPLYQQVFRWFRDKHNILGSIYSNASGYLFEWHDSIGGTHRGWSEYEGPNDGGCWDSYEEAEDACITKLIEIIKEK